MGSAASVRHTWLLLVAWLLASAAAADDWRSPVSTFTQSASGKFSVRIAPGSGTADSDTKEEQAEEDKAEEDKAEEDKADDHAQAKVFALTADGVQGLVWEGPLRNPRAPVDVVISGDGVLVTADQWGSAGYGEVLTIYDRRGKVRYAFTLEELLPADRLAEVPISVSSRWWRRAPAEWRIEAEGTLYAHVTITLWNEDRLEVRLRDGEVSYVEVADVGDDPDRLFRRGEAQLQREDYEAAIVTLQKALAGNPRHAAAALSLGKAYQGVHAYARAIAVLEDASRAVPLDAEEAAASAGEEDESGNEDGAAPAAPASLQRDRAVYLRTALARAYREQERNAEAESLLRTVVAAVPQAWPPVRALAGLLLDTGGAQEAEAVLAAHRSQRLAGLEDERARRVSARISHDIGELYAAHGALQRARDTMRAAFDATDPDLLLGFSLARVLGRLGAGEEARDVFGAMRAWALGLEGTASLVARIDAAEAALPAPDPTRGDAATIARLVDDLGSPERTRRAAAAKALGALGPDAAAAVAPLVAVLEDTPCEGDDETLCREVVGALGAIGPAAAAAVPRLLTLLDHPAPRLHVAAATALGQLGATTTPGLMARFTGTDERAALLARSALLQLGPEAAAAVPALRARLADPTANRQLDTAELLAAIAGPAGHEAAPLLLAAAGGDDTSIRLRALTALGNGRLPAGLPVLRAALQDPDPTVRNAAAAALGHFDGLPPDAIAALISALDDDVTTVRLQAVQALGGLGVAPREVFTALERLAGDPNPRLRRAAEEARNRLDTSILYSG